MEEARKVLTQTGNVTGVKMPSTLQTQLTNCLPKWEDGYGVSKTIRFKFTDLQRNCHYLTSETIQFQQFYMVQSYMLFLLSLYFAAYICMYIYIHSTHKFIYIISPDLKYPLNNILGWRREKWLSKQTIFIKYFLCLEGFLFSYFQTWLCFQIKNTQA